jgi:hypothetical protein
MMKVSDLIAVLNTVDPEMDVRLTMNWEYDGAVGSVYVDSGTLYLDDCTADSTNIYGKILYNEVAA